MTTAAVDVLEQRIADAATAYSRLVLLVGAQRSGKTLALREIAARRGVPVLNVNQRLSERLLDLSHRQRVLQIGALLRELLDGQPGDVVILDNLELLFDVQLRSDPLKLLLAAARNRTIVAAWPGAIRGEDLFYAEPGHAEYRRYGRPEALLVEPGGGG